MHPISSWLRVLISRLNCPRNSSACLLEAQYPGSLLAFFCFVKSNFHLVTMLLDASLSQYHNLGTGLHSVQTPSQEKHSLHTPRTSTSTPVTTYSARVETLQPTGHSHKTTPARKRLPARREDLLAPVLADS